VNIIDSPSPNHNARPGRARADLIVIHGTVGSDTGDLDWLRSRESRVSYHYLVQRPGTVHRLVHPNNRAWHAGESAWEGRAGCNDYSIGIGLSNLGDREAYTSAQYTAAGQLCAVLMRDYGIPLERSVGDYHISPGRKTDPWFTFQWMRLAAEISKAAA